MIKPCAYRDQGPLVSVYFSVKQDELRLLTSIILIPLNYYVTTYNDMSQKIFNFTLITYYCI